MEKCDYCGKNIIIIQGKYYEYPLYEIHLIPCKICYQLKCPEELYSCKTCDKDICRKCKLALESHFFSDKSFDIYCSEKCFRNYPLLPI